jgi:hypothetical protein
MADDQEERSFEVVKLRIAFLQHITTLSGAAILIVLALIQRAETPKGGVRAGNRRTLVRSKHADLHGCHSDANPGYRVCASLTSLHRV